MEYTWKKPDEEMFAQIPKKGQGADTSLIRIKDGIHLKDLVYSAVDKEMDRSIVGRSHHYGSKSSLEERRKEQKLENRWHLCDAVNTAIQARFYESDKAGEKFFIGSLPSAKPINIGIHTWQNPNAILSIKHKEDIEFDYFSYYPANANRGDPRGQFFGYNRTNHEELENDVLRCRDLAQGPGSEFLHMLLHIMMIPLCLIAAMFCYMELPDQHIELFSFVEALNLPLFFTADGTKDYNIINGILWIVIDYLVIARTCLLLEGKFKSVGLSCSLAFVHVLLALAHGIAAAHIPIISAFACAACVYGSVIMSIIYLLSLWHFPVNAIKHLLQTVEPLPDISFEENAFEIYRHCRLRMLWYEGATGEKCTGLYPSIIKTLEKCDKIYRKAVMRNEKKLRRRRKK